MAIIRVQLDRHGRDHAGVYRGRGAPLWRYQALDRPDGRRGWVRAETRSQALEEVRRVIQDAEPVRRLA